MQFIVISHQLYEFFLGILIGLASGFVYDALRFLRKFCKNKRLDVFFANVMDIIFAVFLGSEYCIYIYYASSGRFRWFTAAAVFIGYFVYTVCPSKIIRPVFFWIAERICSLFKILLMPLVRLFNMIHKSVQSLSKNLSFKRKMIITENLKLQLCYSVKLLADGDYYEVDSN